MSVRFAARAARLAGEACALLGWGPDLFWRATPEELAGVAAALRGDAVESASAADLKRLEELFPDG
jgi:hypothetical protein